MSAVITTLYLILFALCVLADIELKHKYIYTDTEKRDDEDNVFATQKRGKIYIESSKLKILGKSKLTVREGNLYMRGHSEITVRQGSDLTVFGETGLLAVTDRSEVRLADKCDLNVISGGVLNLMGQSKAYVLTGAKWEIGGKVSMSSGATLRVERYADVKSEKGEIRHHGNSFTVRNYATLALKSSSIFLLPSSVLEIKGTSKWDKSSIDALSTDILLMTSAEVLISSGVSIKLIRVKKLIFIPYTIFRIPKFSDSQVTIRDKDACIVTGDEKYNAPGTKQSLDDIWLCGKNSHAFRADVRRRLHKLDKSQIDEVLAILQDKHPLETIQRSSIPPRNPTVIMPNHPGSRAGTQFVTVPFLIVLVVIAMFL